MQRLSYTVACELARRNLIDFSSLSNPRYSPQPFHYTVADHLCKVDRGEITRLIILMPPRCGKSEMVSKRFPPFYLGRSNGHGLPRNVIQASYNTNLAKSFGRVARNIAGSRLFYDIFHKGLDRHQGMASADWSLTDGASYIASGVNGGLTGLGANVFIIDDPIKDRRQADSAKYREDLKDWFREVAYTRLTPDGAVVLVMTRWHHDDLAGWLLSEWPDEGWVVLRFPAIQEEPNPNDPRPYDLREEGEVLWPEKFSKEKVGNIADALGDYSFNCLYQQSPRISDSGVIDVGDIQFDFDLDSLPKMLEVISSWDTAFEKTSTADYTVGEVWGNTGEGYYLLDVVREKMRFPELRSKLISSHKKWRNTLDMDFTAVLIEDKASGKDLRYELNTTTTLPLVAVNPTTDKVSRAAAVSGRFKAGRIHLPHRASWKRAFLTELEQFPKSAHDDQVDACTQAIRWFSRYGQIVIKEKETI